MIERIRWRLWHGQVRKGLDLIGETMAMLKAHSRNSLIGQYGEHQDLWGGAPAAACAPPVTPNPTGALSRAAPQILMLSNQQTEARIGCSVINRMTRLGVPVSVHVR